MEQRSRRQRVVSRRGVLVEPWQVRAMQFDTRWRGLDPAAVYAYLRQLADELDRLTRQAAVDRAEADRLREGLRQWRQRHVGCQFNDPPAGVYRSEHQRQTGNGGHW
ncbi:DivIVA domain-containing protein [Micromonospora sp. LOL_015]|uniref:DivIVA domain-containing protein n=1 Tax=Micromonospora sp. LOL_015 TaxID=3345416 RepID=UPI003A89FBB0